MQPLGAVSALTDDAAKDDEERRLESLLFGTTYEPSGSAARELLTVDETGDETGAGERQLQNLLDTDVSFSPYVQFLVTHNV